ncbi:efflux RND transporter periplasmic adaptor subunit [Algirhabdus cladophorae]|uniref:efflux RND transporter periplasmic adaptor subunit n=1 Tax=Algirhabdus cladophorae TaxID=3377108 RepID=UPI003B8456AC
MAHSILKQIVKRLVIVTGTVVVIATAGVAITFGSEALANRAASAPTPDAAKTVPVSVAPITLAHEYTTQRRFLGQIEPATEALLSFELNGRLSKLLVGEGDSVAKGELVARLDTSLLDAERKRLLASQNATRAQLTFAKTRLARAQDLQAEGFSSQETLDQAQATFDELTSRISEIDAALLTLDINSEKSVLYAPFAGRVGAQDVEEMETLTAGQSVLTLIETSTPQVRVGLPLHLSAEDIGQVSIVVNGIDYPATLDQLRPDIDPATRTRTALFSLQSDATFAFGQSATLSLETTVQATGTWIGLDALQQGSGSIWTVLVVEDGIVRTAAVEVLYLQDEQAFVRGSFAQGTQMIQSGAHRVVPGQQVQILAGEG